MTTTVAADVSFRVGQVTFSSSRVTSTHRGEHPLVAVGDDGGRTAATRTRIALTISSFGLAK